MSRSDDSQSCPKCHAQDTYTRWFSMKEGTMVERFCVMCGWDEPLGVEFQEGERLLLLQEPLPPEVPGMRPPRAYLPGDPQTAQYRKMANARWHPQHAGRGSRNVPGHVNNPWGRKGKPQ